MKVVFTTLSIGVPYTKDYTLKLINDVLNKTPHSIYVTTDCVNIINEFYGNESRVIVTEIKREDIQLRINTDWGVGRANDFNFNLRYVCFESVKDLDDHLIIFTDCDNSLDWWDENLIEGWVTERVNEGYDFFAPRNGLTLKNFLDDYKNQEKKEHGIFWHKLYNYNLIDNPKPEWDNSPLPAEYLLVFYNNQKKVTKFYEQWKWFHDYLVNQNKSYGTWAEGFEIGVSSLVANMKPYDIGWNHHIWKRVITPNGYKVGHQTER